MTSPIEWLMDREILRQFPQRYARAVDQRDHDALTALFDPDGSVDGTFGQQAVADYLDTMALPPRHRRHQHARARRSAHRPRGRR